MNKLQAHIAEIEVNGSLSLVTVRVSDTCLLRTIIVETPQSAGYLKIDHPIFVMFKETEVVIAIGNADGISMQNQIKGRITKLETGQLITKLFIATDVGTIISIISTHSVNQLALKVESEVTAMIKLNEIMLSE